MLTTGTSADIAQEQALRLRAAALSAWEEGESTPVVAGLLLRSRELFEESGRRPAAAVSAAVAGLLLSDGPEPDLALRYIEAALLELRRSAPPFLLVLTAHGQALCLATLDRPSDALAILRDPTVPVLAAPDEVLAAQWLRARACAVLGHGPEPLRDLETLLDRFLDNRRFREALLAALDLCQLGSAAAARLGRLETLLQAALPPDEPYRTWLRAFRTLTSDLRSGLEFRQAAGAFPVLVPSCHRFSLHFLCLGKGPVQ